MTTAERVRKAEPIFDLILDHEASPAAQRQQGVSSPFNVVWGGIKPKDRMKTPIVECTLRQVLKWQSILDPLYMSEAVGGFQFMEDTLYTLDLPSNPNILFDEFLQKDLALQLLDRRGWARLEDGLMTVISFANNLAKEWASLPVVTDLTVVRKGRRRLIRRGQSFYAGDRLNKASASPEDVLAAIEKALGTPKPEGAPPLPVGKPEGEDKPWSTSELALIASLLQWVQGAPPADEETVQQPGAVDAVLAWRRAMPQMKETAK